MWIPGDHLPNGAARVEPPPPPVRPTTTPGLAYPRPDIGGPPGAGPDRGFDRGWFGESTGSAPVLSPPPPAGQPSPFIQPPLPPSPFAQPGPGSRLGGPASLATRPPTLAIAPRS